MEFVSPTSKEMGHPSLTECAQSSEAGGTFVEKDLLMS